MMRTRTSLKATIAAAVLCIAKGVATAQGVSAGDDDAIQAAIDANPGKVVVVPPGDHRLTKKLRIGAAGGGLVGFGRIIQTNPAEPILEIEHASGVCVRDVTLARADGKQDATAPGLFVWDSRHVVIDGVQVIDNHARDAAIELRETRDCTVRNARVLNYKRIAVDDRTDSPHYGYAFHCIDGTGIMVRESTGTILSGNRIVESRLLPTRDLKGKHKLGKLTKGRHPSKPGKLAVGVLLRGRVDNWHQGSAIVVTSPTKTRRIHVIDNDLVNAAQGIDIHADHVVCRGNTIDHAMIGIKATHGSQHLLIDGNLISHVDLWGILLNPGASSHRAAPAKPGKPGEADEQPAQPANVDGGTLIRGNIITAYGYGHEYWNWGGRADDLGSSYAIALYAGQLPTNPPLSDVLIQGNIVYHTGRDGRVIAGAKQDSSGATGGKVVKDAPRYRYAVYVGGWHGPHQRDPSFPRDLHFADNLFHPGTQGVSNVELKP